MATWQWTIYPPPEKGLPFLAVLISGVRVRKVEFAIPAKTEKEAEEILKGKIAEGVKPKNPVVAALEERGRNANRA